MTARWMSLMILLAVAAAGMLRSTLARTQVRVQPR